MVGGFFGLREMELVNNLNHNRVLNARFDQIVWWIVGVFVRS
jgi:hypothetical protein